MTIAIASPEANPACVAHAPDDAAILTPTQSIAAKTATNCAPSEANPFIRYAVLAAGLLLCGVSVSLAAQAGWHRGATQPESWIWTTAGVALAVVSLTGLSAALSSRGVLRAAATTAWLLSLLFVVVAGLGSQHGGRELAARTDGAATSERARHEAAYKRASAELEALPTARPAGVIKTELVVVLKDTRLRDCQGWLASRRLRTVCVEKVEPLRAELANAQAREKARRAMTDATAALAAVPTTAPANSDATALARYLAAVGIVIPLDRLADLISLLVVISIEIVGAVAIAFGRSPQSLDVAPQARQQWTVKPESPTVKAAAVPTRTEAESNERPRSLDRPSPQDGMSGSNDVDRRRARIVQRLMDGALVGTQESIAARVGIPKTTMRRLVETDSRLRLSVGPTGSRLELATA